MLLITFFQACKACRQFLTLVLCCLEKNLFSYDLHQSKNGQASFGLLAERCWQKKNNGSILLVLKQTDLQKLSRDTRHSILLSFLKVLSFNGILFQELVRKEKVWLCIVF